MAYQTIALTVTDRVATVTMNRPDKLNALNDEMIEELGLAVDEIHDRADVSGVILTGAGRAFVAGADIAELEYAIEHGAVGATCNPVIALGILKKDIAAWRPRIASLLRETSTLGVRSREVRRYEAGREALRFDSSLGEVAVKLKRLPGEPPRVAPEYEDCRRLGDVAQVMRAAAAAARRELGLA